MNSSDKLQVKGNLIITLISEAGEMKDVREVSNLVVNTGKNYIASRMTGTSATVMSHMAVGDSNSSPNGTPSPNLLDIGLTSELGRVAMTSFTTLDNKVTAIATFPAGTGTGGLVEAGIFNNASGGDMLCRTTFDIINKGAGDILSITWTIETVSA